MSRPAIPVVRRPVLACALAVLSVLPVAPAGAAAAAPSQPAAATAPRRMISAWLPYWTHTSALSRVRANADLYTDASPFWFDLGDNGSLRRKAGSVTDARIAETVADLHAVGLPVYPTVGESLNTPEMASFLADRARRARHVADLVSLVEHHRFDGIDLDYESMVFGGTVAQRAQVRDGFSALCRELAGALHAEGKILSVTVGPRRSDTDPNWAVYDYAALGTAADRFRIMTYDYGWKGSKKANPVAPLWWVDSIIGYAVSRVPAAKIWVGVPTYGYDWPAGRTGSAVSFAQAQELQRTHRAPRRWRTTVSPADGRPVHAPYFTYRRDGVQHTVYYNDAASARSLVSLVGKYRLGGAALWGVGSEDAATWRNVRSYAATIAPTATTTTLRPQAGAVSYGRSAGMSVAVRDRRGRAMAGVRVTLQGRTSATGRWRSLAVTRTAADGRATFAVRPRGTTEYRVYTSHTWASQGSLSTPRRLTVTRSVTGGAPPSVKSGRAVRVSGTAFPGSSGLTVQVQRYARRQWPTVASARTGTGGRYAVSVPAVGRGRALYRVRVVGTRSHGTGYSKPVVVTVR